MFVPQGAEKIPPLFKPFCFLVVDLAHLAQINCRLFISLWLDRIDLTITQLLPDWSYLILHVLPTAMGVLYNPIIRNFLLLKNNKNEIKKAIKRF